jgi:hypothetical protein
MRDVEPVEPQPVDPTIGATDHVGEPEDDEDHLADVDEEIADDPVFDASDFDPRSDAHEQVFAFDESLTTDGGDATSDHDGLHDLGDVAESLADLGDLFGD